MRLHDVPNGSRILLRDRNETLELKFERIDGMYAHCTTDDGVRVYMPATFDVEVIGSKE